MRRHLAASVLTVLAVALGLQACGTKGGIELGPEPQRAFAGGTTVALTVVADSSAGEQDAAARIRERLFGALMAEGLFRQVLPPDDTTEYVLQVALFDVKRVSGTSRVLFGALAGRNRIRASVRLSRAGSPEPIRTFTVTGESASHPNSPDAGFEDAVREFVQHLVRGLRG